MENPIKMDDLGYHYFLKHPYIYTYIYIYIIILLSPRLICHQVWTGNAVTSGRVLVITDEIGLREMELPQNFPGSVFFRNKKLRQEVSMKQGLYHKCIRQLGIYV